MKLHKTASKRYFPLSSFQKHLMLAAALDPKTTIAYHSLCTVKLGVRIQPGLSPRILRRAFNGLVRRHNSLRLRLVHKHDEWMAEILEEHPIGLIEKNFGTLDTHEQMQEIEGICAVPKTALDEALFEMQLLKFGSCGDVVLIRAHHAIIDGYSIALLLEELLGLIVGIPSDRPAISHGDFIARREACLQNRAAEKELYWQKALLPLPEPQFLGRHKLGLPPADRQTIEHSIKLENIFSEATQIHLSELEKRTSMSSYCHLNAAFADAVCEIGGGSEVLFLCVLGRQDANLAGFIGAEFQLMRLKYQKGGGAESILNLFSEGADMLPTSVFDPSQPLDGIEYPYLVNKPTPTARLRRSPFQNLFDQAFKGKFRMGIFSLERVPIKARAESHNELQLRIIPDSQGEQANLIADAAAWTSDDLASLAELMKHQLRRVS